MENGTPAFDTGHLSGLEKDYMLVQTGQTCSCERLPDRQLSYIVLYQTSQVCCVNGRGPQYKSINQ